MPGPNHELESGRGPGRLAKNAIPTSNFQEIPLSELRRNETVKGEEKPESDAAMLLAAIVESSNDAIVSKNLDGTILSWNPAAASLFGYSSDEALGHSIMMLIPKERRDEEPIIIDRIRRGLRVDQYETIRRHKDGHLLDVSLTVSPLKNANGTIIGASKIARDISGKKAAEQSMRLLAGIVESSDDAIIGKSLDGIIRSWNRGAERLFGYQAVEVIGRPVTLLIPVGRENEEPDILTRVRRGERVHHYETVRQRKDGSLVEISLTVSPVHDGSGKIVGASKIARDISQLKAATREAELARDKAIAATRAKDDFLAALSHELRTPLNPVLLLATHAAEDPSLPSHIRDDFELIRKNVELEARLIDDLLDMTHVTRGKVQLNRQTYGLQAVLADALATTRADFDAKGVNLFCEFAEEPMAVSADAVRLQQVIWNVLKNAVKFTPSGGKVVVRMRRDDPPTHGIIEVEDTGIGMTQAELGRIFDAFAQGDHATSQGGHRFGGLGLGLAISHKLAELQGASLTATSPGRGLGSTFTIKLPLVGSREVTANGPSVQRSLVSDLTKLEPTGLRGRILLVEDHEATRSTLARLLTRRDFDVISAANAKEAVDFANSNAIDLVISDIGLPDATGYELLARLRTGRKLRAIALTGYGNDEDIARTRAAGFSTHLTKPIAIAALDAALTAALSMPAL